MTGHSVLQASVCPSVNGYKNHIYLTELLGELQVSSFFPGYLSLNLPHSNCNLGTVMGE